MKTGNLSGLYLAGATAAAVASCAQAPEDERPNVVLILADDLGYSDAGCYGGEINTPNIDSLADNGLRYLNFYNSARSCPSRSCLMTGLYPHSAGVGHMVKDRGLPAYRGRIADNAVTIAEMLQGAGYQTAMTGKWHVSHDIDPEGTKKDWPLQRGFERFYGTLTGHGSFWNPKCLYEGNDPAPAEGDYYYTEQIAGMASSYIEEMDRDRPFFLYVAFTAPHYPLHAREEYIERYDGTYSEGWDSLRVRRFERMKTLGVLPQNAVLPTKDPMCHDWKDDPEKDWQQRRMETFAAMVEQMDEGIGKIVGTLRKTGEVNNTIVIFLSDNGASAEGHLDNTVERLGTPWSDPMIPSHTKDGRPVRAGDFPEIAPGPDDTYGSYGPQWAHLSATPYKRFKSWVHEGGIHTPMILSWGDRIKDKGGFRHGIYSILDFMPTLMEISSGTYPEEIRGMKTMPYEGQSFLKSIDSDDFDPERTLFWEHEGNRAVRKGHWKLVSEFPGTWSSMRPYPENGGWELYNLEEDCTETENLASEHPETVKELAALWDEWARAHNVVDWSLLGE